LPHECFLVIYGSIVELLGWMLGQVQLAEGGSVSASICFSVLLPSGGLHEKLTKEIL